jgi:hypothetical protein
VPSSKQISFYVDDYDNYFSKTANVAAPGVTPAWTINRESLQVAGLGTPGGWSDVVHLTYAR